MLRWFALGCCLFLARPQDPADKVNSLVEKLGSDDVETRGAAQRELTIVGRTALPLLDKAFASARGEQKQQLLGVIQHITAFGTPPLVTLEAKDRPLRLIAGDLQRQTGIQVRTEGAIAEVKVSVSASGSLLWKVLDGFCRAHGHLMYRFVNHAVEIYPSKFRALPTVDGAGLSFFVDRFIWERGHLGPGHFRMHGGLLTAPGARVIWIEVKVDELTDDKGKNLAHLPEGGGYFLPTGERFQPRSDGFLSPVNFQPAIQGTPTAGAEKLRRFSGEVDVLLAAGERMLASIKEPLARPATASGEGPIVLGITKWARQDGHLRVQIESAWGGDATKSLDRKASLLFYLRLKDGGWLPAISFHGGHTNDPGEASGRTEGQLWFELPDEAVVESLELVAPDPVIKVEIPFDFRDIPLR